MGYVSVVPITSMPDTLNIVDVVKPLVGNTHITIVQASTTEFIVHVDEERWALIVTLAAGWQVQIGRSLFVFKGMILKDLLNFLEGVYRRNNSSLELDLVA